MKLIDLIQLIKIIEKYTEESSHYLIDYDLLLEMLDDCIQD